VLRCDDAAQGADRTAQVDDEGLPRALGESTHEAVTVESEATYLRRANLLRENEAARVTRSQYRPRTLRAMAEYEPAA
jgi:hypothetical protein